MPNLIIRFLGLLVIFLSLSCSKKDIVKNEDLFIEESEQLSELKAEVSAAALKFIEVQWNPVRSTHFKKVTYSLYLDGQMIIEGLNVTNYSLVNLQPGRKYAIKIEAATEDELKTSQTLTASTLTFNETDQILYQKISIHTYSIFLGPGTICQLSDGGHVIVRYLQHPSFRAEDGFKIVVMRIDKSGHLLWYRLFEPPNDNIHTSITCKLTLHNNETEGIVFVHNYAFKISLLNSKIVFEKDFHDLDELGIESSFYTSDGQLFIGTRMGSLLCIDPDDLSIRWRYTNQNQRGVITAIIIDSQKNIYTSFIDYADPTSSYVLKFNTGGEYITRFQFDRSAYSATFLVDEQDNLYMFPMTGDENTILYYKFKGSGELITQNSIKGSITSPQAFWDNSGKIVLFGDYNGSGRTKYSGIYTFDKSMNVLSKRFYNHLPNHHVHALTENTDGTYNFFLDVSGSETGDFVFIKSDAKGNI